MVSLPHSLPLSPSCCSHRPPSPHGWAGMPRAQPPTVSPAGAPFPGHSTLLQCSRCHSLPNRAYASTPSLPHLRIADSRSPGMSTLYTHPPVEPRVSPLVQPLSPPRVTPPPQRTACEAATLQPCPTPSISSSRPARPPPCLRPSLVRPRCPLMRPTSTSLSQYRLQLQASTPSSRPVHLLVAAARPPPRTLALRRTAPPTPASPPPKMTSEASPPPAPASASQGPYPRLPPSWSRLRPTPPPTPFLRLHPSASVLAPASVSLHWHPHHHHPLSTRRRHASPA